MNDLRAITTVYSYYLPEIRRLIEGIGAGFQVAAFIGILAEALQSLADAAGLGDRQYQRAPAGFSRQCR